MNDSNLNVNLIKEDEYFKSHDELIWFNEKGKELNIKEKSNLKN